MSDYEVVLSRVARRALAELLPEGVAAAAWELVKGTLSERPSVGGRPLREPFEGYWRARRGEYRVRCRINEVQYRVEIDELHRRRDAYRP